MAVAGYPLGAAQAGQMGAGLMPSKKQPFQWGQGGKRMTPEEIEIMRELSQQQMATGMDTSPIGHWSQGLGRIGQGLIGGLQNRRADKASKANMAESDEVLQALMQPDVSSETAAAAMGNAYISKEAQQLAKMAYDRANPKPQADPEAVLLARIANDPSRPEAERVAASERLTGINDPFTSLIVGGNTVMGRQSQVQQALQGGGGLTSGGGPRPGTVEDGFVFRGGDPSDQSNWEPVSTSNTPAPQQGANGIPSQLSRQQYMAVVNAKGKEATDAWIARNNVKVGN